MASGQIPVKVYYLEGGVQKEIRKFTLEQDASTSYTYLLGRIKVFFNSLLRKDLDVYWKDEEGDMISISSDAELMEVMKSTLTVEGEHLKLYIRVRCEPSVPMNNQHRGVLCDQCDCSINGIRYKCMVCPDYDLCSTCEAKQTHPMEHNMMCIKKPGSVYRSFKCRPWFKFENGPRGCRSSSTEASGSSSDQAKSSTPEEKTDKPCMPHFNDMIKEMASVFGFDPNVAVSQLQSCMQQFSQQPNAQQEGDTEKKDDNVPEKANEENAKQEYSSSENVPSTSAPNTDNDSEQKDDTKNATSAQGPSTSNDLGAALHPLLNQFGAIPADQFQNLGKMMETVFQTMGSQGASGSGTSHGCKSQEENKKSDCDGFVVVDEKAKKDEITEEELFQIRLDETLRQMEGMGFDNDGDWLKQLLIAKDLDISRVLDAMKLSR